MPPAPDFGLRRKHRDAFSAFPPEVFEPDEPGDGGDGPPDIPGAGGVEEVGFLEAAQGVTGDVRNVVLAQIGAQSVAFLAAGRDGLHVVDMTEPEMTNVNSFIRSVAPGSLVAPAAIAGGRIDALAVVDNTYLVCLAVGSGAAHAVTVFHIPTLIDTTLPASDAFVERTGGPDIAVPGLDLGLGLGGQGGGVSGRASSFVVATGGPRRGWG